MHVFAGMLVFLGRTVAPKDSNQRPQRIREWIAGYTQFFVELAMLLSAWVFPMLWVVKIVSFGIYLLQIPITYAVRRLDYVLRRSGSCRRHEMR